MAQFLGIHNISKMLIDESKPIEGDPWTAYKASCAKRGDCKALHVHFNEKAGKAFCVSEAESADVVRAAHADVNLALEDIIEVGYQD